MSIQLALELLKREDVYFTEEGKKEILNVVESFFEGAAL